MCAHKDDSCAININNGLLLYYHQYSYYSQKVLMALHEKKLSFATHIIDLSKSAQYETWFLKLNPRGEIPVLQDVDKIIPDSNKIIDYLEDHYCQEGVPKLIPMDQGAELRQKVTYFRNILDQIPSGIITVGSFFHPDLVDKPKAPFFGPLRKLLINAENKSIESLKQHAERNPQNKKVLLQKVDFQEKKHHIITNKDEFLNVLSQLETVLDKVETELESHKEEQENWWLCTNSFTVADISLTILLERLNQLGFEYRFWKNLKRPCIEKYYQRVKSRPSYQNSIPSNFFHFQVFVKAQKPIVLGIALFSTLTLILGSYFIIKKAIL